MLSQAMVFLDGRWSIFKMDLTMYDSFNMRCAVLGNECLEVIQNRATISFKYVLDDHHVLNQSCNEKGRIQSSLE